MKIGAGSRFHQWGELYLSQYYLFGTKGLYTDLDQSTLNLVEFHLNEAIKLKHPFILIKRKILMPTIKEVKGGK